MARTPRGYDRKGRIVSLCAMRGSDALIVDPAAGTITRGTGRKGTVMPLDGVTAHLEGGGSTARPGAVVAFGVAGLASRKSQLYLVVDGPVFQWRITVTRPDAANLFVENLTTLQRQRAAAASA